MVCCIACIRLKMKVAPHHKQIFKGYANLYPLPNIIAHERTSGDDLFYKITLLILRLCSKINDFSLIYLHHPSRLPGKERRSDGASSALPTSIKNNRASTVAGSSRGGHGAAHGDVYGQMESIFIDSATGVVQRLMSCSPNT